jgi:hypothetical protein
MQISNWVSNVSFRMAHALQTLAREPNGERSPLLGLKTSTLEAAKSLGDSVAAVSHLCNDNCEDWKAVAA